MIIVRSQDKATMITNPALLTKHTDTNNYVIFHAFDRAAVELGTYSSLERCFEIFDEIMQYADNGILTYRMPEV